jgi:hypothetical protein
VPAEAMCGSVIVLDLIRVAVRLFKKPGNCAWRKSCLAGTKVVQPLSRALHRNRLFEVSLTTCFGGVGASGQLCAVLLQITCGSVRHRPTDAAALVPEGLPLAVLAPRGSAPVACLGC